jgi:hypothetical protein
MPMASRRIIIDPTHPVAMTPEQRRAELASILAAGVIRQFEQRHLAAISMSQNAADSGETGLEVPPDPRPYGPLVNALRERQLRRHRMGLNVGKEIADLKQMAVPELREKYHAVFGEPTRAGNKDWLFKRIAWRIQALAEGDLSERARKRAAEIARDADIRMTMPKPPKTSPGAEIRTAAAPVPLGDNRLPTPGTVLTRTYRGRAYEVTVLPKGFEYDGEVYRTLSAIAKKITGSYWNGFLFFGLAKPGPEARDE